MVPKKAHPTRWLSVLRLKSANGVLKTPLDFWDDPAEDVYSKDDGQTIATTYETVNHSWDAMAGNYEAIAGRGKHETLGTFNGIEIRGRRVLQ